MTDRPLKAVPTAPEDAWVRHLADLIDGDQWTLADTLVEHYPLEEFPDTGDTNNGLHVALRQDELALARRFGIIATVGHLRKVRSTAIAWPRGHREPRASFTVHMMMRGHGRQTEMKTRLRQADREGMALSTRMLARLRADENPKPARQYDERMRRAIVAAVRREMLGGVSTKADDWWMTTAVTQGSRDVAVRELRRLADAIEAGRIRDE